MKDFLGAEEVFDSPPGAFWQDYFTCANVTNMPAHALHAYDSAKAAGADSQDYATIASAIHERTRIGKLTANYDSHTAWKAVRSGEHIRFTSGLCGESFVASPDSPVDVHDVQNSTCVVTITPGNYPTRHGRSSPTLLLLTQPAKPGESLEAFTHRLLSDPRYAGARPTRGLPCPVSECLSFDIVTDAIYKGEGGGHFQIVSFSSEQPDYPGLKFEEPQSLPSTGKSDRFQYFRPDEILQRFPGTLYTFVALDSNQDIYDRSHVDLLSLLQSMEIDFKP